MSDLTHPQLAVRITTIIAIATTLLAILKLVFGVLGKSHALFADGIHSAADLLIDVMVLFAAHYAHKQADFDHPYGHGRIETAATLALAVILILAGVGIIINAGEHLWGRVTIPTPNIYVLVIAAISAIVNEALFHYSLRVAKQIKSNLLVANAWHCRSDVFASLVVFFGVACALLGYPHLDAVAAVIVGLMIIQLGAKIAWSSVSELVDTGVDNKTLELIKSAINKVPHVQALHQLRTRTINNAIFLDVHILVAPRLSVSEGHFIGEQVRTKLMREVPNVKDITLHIDPEDDELAEIRGSFNHLPSRDELIKTLKERWQNQIKEINDENIILHYLSGKIYIELRLPASLLTTKEHVEDVINELREKIRDIEVIAKLDLFFY
jgi:cation diffusion facilitator family transporter